MYEVEIWTTLPGVEGEVHFMSQTSIKTYEEAVKVAEYVTELKMRPVIKELEAA